MRKLDYPIDMDHLEQIRQEIVPAIFTKHQFELIRKRSFGAKMTISEKNEFSRTVSKKMKAMILMTKTHDMHINGKEDILSGRLSQAQQILVEFSKKHRNQHVIISGSFLFSQKYNDIDVFIISRYSKDSKIQGDYHINHMTEDFYGTLLFASIRKLCISNKSLDLVQTIAEKPDARSLISTYQVLMNLISQKKPFKDEFRNFFLVGNSLSQMDIPGPKELSIIVESLGRSAKPAEMIKNMLVNFLSMSEDKKRLLAAAREMAGSYTEMINDFPRHRQHYQDIMEPFLRVIEIES